MEVQSATEFSQQATTEQTAEEASTVKGHLTVGHNATGALEKMGNNGSSEVSKEDAAKDATRAMLKQLIKTGAPLARSIAIAAGLQKSYDPLAFWREFDYVRLTLCSADTRQKYGKYDTIMLSVMHFSMPEEIMKAHQTALLLFDVDRTELVGVWKAVEAVVEGNNTYIIWRVVRRLPAMSREAFRASAAGAIFSELPPTDTSASARGEAARLVLRVLSEHAASVAPAKGLVAVTGGVGMAIPTADAPISLSVDESVMPGSEIANAQTVSIPGSVRASPASAEPELIESSAPLRHVTGSLPSAEASGAQSAESVAHTAISKPVHVDAASNQADIAAFPADEGFEACGALTMSSDRANALAAAPSSLHGATDTTPSPVPLIVFGASNAVDDLNSVHQNAAVPPVVVSADHDAEAPTITVTPKLPAANGVRTSPAILGRPAARPLPSGAAPPPPVYMPPGLMQQVQRRVAQAASQPLGGVAPPRPVAAALTPAVVTAAPVHVVAAAPVPVANVAAAASTVVPLQYPVMQPALAPQAPHVRVVGPKADAVREFPPPATLMNAPVPERPPSPLVRVVAPVVQPQPAPAAVRPSFLAAVRVGQPQPVAPGLVAVRPAAPQAGTRPVPAAVAATAQPIVRAAQGIPARLVGGVGLGPPQYAQGRHLSPAAVSTESAAVSGPQLPSWTPTPVVLQPQVAPAPAVVPAETPVPGSYLLCPLCNQRTGSWFLMTCNDMGPCDECCASSEQVQTMYPVCRRCGKTVSAGKTIKTRVS